MNIALLGSSLESTYFRGIIRALEALGHRFGSERDADVIIHVSDAPIDEIISRRKTGQIAIFWDVDFCDTLDRLATGRAETLRAVLHQYDIVLTSGGGDPVITRYRSLGARECVPIYPALDPSTHHRVASRPELAADLSFAGHRVADRERRVDELFFRPASLLPDRRFLLGGAGWADKKLPPSFRYAGPVAVENHNAFNSSSRAVLNVTREGPAGSGWSPGARLFEAAGAAACIITDMWEGMEHVFDPGAEVLVAASGDEVADIVRTLDPDRAAALGRAALRRTLAQHTYTHRAGHLNDILESRHRQPRTG